MKTVLSSIKGMNDILPLETPQYRLIEQQLHSAARGYDYQEIRMPLLEQTALFQRSIGEVTDIVQKEMYTFVDHYNQDQLTLRPEGTASCVRACIQHGLLHNQTQRLWYLGPMFRHENPQKGRYRQFHQFGVEAYGFDDVGIELEQLSLCAAIWRAFSLQAHVKLTINTLGTPEDRAAYVEQLKAYLTKAMSAFDDELKQRAMANPLRILDSKATQLQPIIAEAPSLFESLSSTSRQRFETLCQGLQALDIDFEHQPRLVRGLDYYAHTVFEWVTSHLGAQGTVCAGGRYDSLVEQIGGKPNHAVGFALGLERLKLLVDGVGQMPEQACHSKIYVIIEKEVDPIYVLQVIESCRQALPECIFTVDFSQSALKHQLKRAEKHSSSAALLFKTVFGCHPTQVQVKPFIKDSESLQIASDDLVVTLRNILQA